MDNMAPLQSDLTVDTNYLEVIKGLDNVLRTDKTISAGFVVGEGDWAVLDDNDELVAPAAGPVANTYPVWAGNESGRSDVHATGMATILMGGRFIYRTTKYNTAGSYSVGTPITVKVDATIYCPTPATGTEAVLGRVTKVPANGVIEIEVISQ